MGLEALSNFYDYSSKVGVFLGAANILTGTYNLWHLNTPLSPQKEESDLPKDNTTYTAIKSKAIRVIGTITNGTSTLCKGVAFGFSLYAIAKHYDEPCVLAKMTLSIVSAELLASRKTAEIITQLCPSIILKKISSHEEKNSAEDPIDRNNLEKKSVEVIHKSLKCTAAITKIAYGLYSICSNIQPLKDAWNGMSPSERVYKRIEERSGNEILGFEENCSKKILFLQEQDTTMVVDSAFINSFKADHDIKFKVLAPGESAYAEICDALKTGNLKAVYHNVHGNPYSLGTEGPTLDELSCISKYLPEQIEKPAYILQSCEAGYLATSKQGPAVEIAKNTGMKVFANTRTSTDANLIDINTNPVEVTFTEFHSPWIESTVTIEPNKEGYVIESPRTADSYFLRLKRTFDYLIFSFRF